MLSKFIGRIRGLFSTLFKSAAGRITGLGRRGRTLLHLAVVAGVVVLLLKGRGEPSARPVIAPQATAGATDNRPDTRDGPPANAGDTTKSEPAPRGAETKAAAAPDATAPARPAFHDARPLSEAQTAAATAAPSFRDARPIAAPSFRDPRAISPAEPLPVAASPAMAKPMPAAESAVPQGNADQPQTTLVAVPPAPLKIDAGTCGPPDVVAEPMDGGRMRIAVTAPCRANEAVQISYGGAEIIRRLDQRGALDYALDCFAGATMPAELRFADGLNRSLPIVARDLDTVSKIAVIWRAPVNLDLHVFEYAARIDGPGHLWAKAPSSLEAARSSLAEDKRGHGFISTSDNEASLGDKVEVYTFLHSDEQTSGAISLALDYETRGEVPSGQTCGQGSLAEIDFQVSMRPRGGQATRQSGVLTRVDCGQRIARGARLNQAALPGLRIRR